jgi:FMN reductase
MSTIVGVVGNPRPESRTHAICRELTRAIARATGGEVGEEVDLAVLGSRVLDWGDDDAKRATERVLQADVLVVASPTYKATYSGLTKAFLDRIGGGALAGAPAVPVLLGGAPDHRLAVDAHFTPLLLELGAGIPVRGLFVLESDVEDFAAFADEWAQQHRDAFRRG